jgi:hypothetical protein
MRVDGRQLSKAGLDPFRVAGWTPMEPGGGH